MPPPGCRDPQPVQEQGRQTPVHISLCGLYNKFLSEARGPILFHSLGFFSAETAAFAKQMNYKMILQYPPMGWNEVLQLHFRMMGLKY